MQQKTHKKSVIINFISYKHFTISERSKLEVLYNQGKTLREISKELGKYYSSISRKLNRNGRNKKYICEKVQKESELRKH